MRGPAIVFVHSSDEMYGADRVLLEMLVALSGATSAEVWLPLDQTQHQLCAELGRRGVTYRHVRLPIMRRAYRRPLGLVRLAVATLRLGVTLGRAQPTIVYCTTSAALLAAPVARLVGVPRVLGHLQEVWSDGDRPVLTRLARACHSLIAVSGHAADAVGPRLRARVTVVPNATPEPAHPSTLRGRHGALSYVVASRWGKGKGYATLLAAWDELADPGRLTILGGAPPTGAEVDVPGLVAGLRRPDTVSVVGEVNDVAPYLNEADVVVVPSEYPEGFGLVAIEAFAHGRAVVASSAGGLTDLIGHEREGWLFAPGDTAALTSILGSLTRQQVTDAGERAYRTYEQSYTTAGYAARWLSAVTRALGAARIAPGDATG